MDMHSRLSHHMGRTTFIILGILLGTSCGLAEGLPRYSTAGFYAVPGSPRRVYNFNPGWRFYKGQTDGAMAPDFDDSRWQSVNLPHGLEILGRNASGGRNTQGPAWYRKSFRFTPQNENGRVYIYFEAVMGLAKVWVNGQLAADHYGGYLPFALDITEKLNRTGANWVAVLADNTDSKLYPPGQPQNRLDFTYMGGIYRDVYLIETGPVHVTLRELSQRPAGGGIFAATLDVKEKNAQMEVRTELTNQRTQSVELTVQTTLENALFEPVHTLSETVRLAPGETRQLIRTFMAKNVHLWHPDDPYLHTIRTELLDGDQLLDSLRTRIGIRLFELRGEEGLYVNKKWVGKKLIGANRHQDFAYVGNALPNSGQWRDVKLLREGGCHIIRAAHYPQDPAFYDACDSLGMLTTSANPGWHFFNFKEPIFAQRLFDDTRQLVRRDRNHPAILMWETVINEYPSQPESALKTMHQIAHTENPFPGMFTVADFEEARKGGFDMYYNSGDGKKNVFRREYGDGGEVDNFYSQNARTRVNVDWGEAALLRQALIQADTLSYQFNNSRLQLGGALWCGIDHQRGYHPDPFMGGLLDSFRLPRPLYYLYQSQNDPDYQVPGLNTGAMVMIVHELTQVSAEDVVVFSNCDEVRLYWLGQVVGTQRPVNTGAAARLPHPPFLFKNVFDFRDIKKHNSKNRIDNAVMIAEGLINGQVAARTEKVYAQRLSGIRLEVDDQGIDLTADGSDLIPVRAILVDQNGTKKVLAMDPVTFSVSGPGLLIGSAATGANPVRASRGVATALIRADLEPGIITITAQSPGLEGDQLQLRTDPAVLTPLYDHSWAKSAKRTESVPVSPIITEHQNNSEDIKALRKELEQAQLELIGKDQIIMELRSQLKRHQ